MHPFLTENGKTVVTPGGLISPYPGETWRTGGGLNVFAEIPHELTGNDKWEVLRQVVSFRRGNGSGSYRDRKMIQPEEFYPDMWRLEDYETESIDAFFTAFGRVVRRDEFCTAFERGDWVVAFGTTNPEYRTRQRIVDDKHFVFKSILLPNPEDRRLVVSSFATRMAPAVAHVVLVARRHIRAGKPMYRHFKRRTSSKVRDIWAPEDELKAALRHLLRPVGSAYDMSKRGGSPQFAYTPDRNIKMNAAAHTKNKWMLKCDITGFFDACNWNLTRHYLNFLLAGHWSDRNDRSLWLGALKDALINPETGGLYQGSPVSGAISNAILRPAVQYLERFLAKENRVVTVYADDITVSQATEIDQDARNNILGKVRHSFEKFGLPFTLKQSKTKVVRNNGRKVTGIRINHLDQLTIPRRRYRLLRSALHRMLHGRKTTMSRSELKGLLEFGRFNDESGKINKLLEKYKSVLIDSGICFKHWREEEEAEAATKEAQ